MPLGYWLVHDLWIDLASDWLANLCPCPDCIWLVSWPYHIVRIISVWVLKIWTYSLAIPSFYLFLDMVKHWSVNYSIFLWLHFHLLLDVGLSKSEDGLSESVRMVLISDQHLNQIRFWDWSQHSFEFNFYRKPLDDVHRTMSIGWSPSGIMAIWNAGPSMQSDLLWRQLSSM